MPSIETQRRSMGIVLLALLSFIAGSAKAAVYPSYVATQDVFIQKPSFSNITGEALTDWVRTGPVVVGNGGAWGGIDFGLTLSTTLPISYVEGGQNYDVYDVKDAMGNSTGIGFVMSVAEQNCFGACGMHSPTAVQGTDYMILQQGGLSGSSTFWYAVKFVATSNHVTAGRLEVPQQAIGYVQLRGLAHDTAPVSLLGMSVTYEKKGCIPSVSDPIIQMGTVSSLQFTGIGSVVSGGTPVTIDLECDDGLGVYVGMTDQNNPANTSTTLTLSPSDNNAEGVGVQFVRGSGEWVTYGPSSSFVDASSAAQWQVKHKIDTNNKASFTLMAQYVQTSAVMTPGNANALASITFAYD